MLHFFICWALFFIHWCIAMPAPLSVYFGNEFYGTDGLWSAAQLRIGTPEQDVWAYPNTLSSETWVVGLGGCDDTQVCYQSRGGVFNSSASTTYSELGTYDLVGLNRLDLTTDYGNYGLDEISLSDTATAPKQVIASITNPEIWLGQVGLNVELVRLNNQTNYDSLISSLVQNESTIPSHSYGYTAGAHYALKNVPGSLVLGGVDTTRFTPNDAVFSLALGYIPKVAVHGITVSSSQTQGLVALPPNWDTNPLTLMQKSQAAYFIVDTSTPFLWMPPTVCDAFASALNLTYNDTLQLYMFPEDSNTSSSPQILNDWGISFVFTVANSTDPSSAEYQLPITYNAFDLKLTYGFSGLDISYGSPGVNYFPLRKANSSDQYTIGRAFLQESYLMVDYEREIFSLSPAVMVDTSLTVPELVPITRPVGSTWPGPQGTNGLSTGAKAGIAVAVVGVVMSLIVAAFFLFQRRSKAHTESEKAPSKRRWKFFGHSAKANTPADPVSELTGDRRHPRELLVDSSNTRFELPGNAPIEMPAGDIPEAYLAAYKSTDEGPDAIHAVTRAMEPNSEDRQSIRKDYNIRRTATERSSSPAPPYSSSETGQNTLNSSEGVSSYESNPGGYGTHSSSGAAVSPIVRHGTQSPPGGPQSPVSPGTDNSHTMFSHNVASSTQDGNMTAPLIVPIATLSRSDSHSIELVDDNSPVSETQDGQPPLRPRFSWEQ